MGKTHFRVALRSLNSPRGQALLPYLLCVFAARLIRRLEMPASAATATDANAETNAALATLRNALGLGLDSATIGSTK